MEHTRSALFDLQRFVTKRMAEAVHNREMTKMNEAFYIVVCNQRNASKLEHCDTDRYSNEAVAQSRAEQLARSNPGREYIVLRALSKSVTTDVVTTRLVGA